MSEEQKQEIYNLAASKAIRVLEQLRAEMLSEFPAQAKDIVLEAFYDACYGY